jgi:hypothetical protein
LAQRRRWVMSEIRSAAPTGITRLLAADETLTWWDRPIPMLLARHELNANMLFGLFFLAFSIFWMTMAWNAPGPFFLFGAPIVLVGLWLASAPLRAYARASSTLFALTNRRALVLTSSKARTFPLDQIEFVECESFADDTGHVEF